MKICPDSILLRPHVKVPAESKNDPQQVKCQYIQMNAMLKMFCFDTLWNIRSVYSNLENLSFFLSQYQPDLLLNETCFRLDDNFQHNGFVVYRIDKIDGFVGIATLIKYNISHKLVAFDQHFLPELCHLQILHSDAFNRYALCPR